ncbi:hypothetical protein F7725_000057 [Dissostichus mawsoni]|uniref:Uncharacterized protein n=1 Tax=Dissostichus mawsoni TaxID=36200 RepID=A0A7J5ZD92_DISMA|nr:hypothetical protein F7725_000057 [Dissostichus mawsoni]
MSWTEQQGQESLISRLEQLKDVQHSFHAKNRASAQQIVKEIEDQHIDEIMKSVHIFSAAGKHFSNSNQSYKFLIEGGFVARRSDERSFNCVATDQALEQTINREGKSEGGVIGLTLKKGALTRWLMTRHSLNESGFQTFSDLAERVLKRIFHFYQEREKYVVLPWFLTDMTTQTPLSNKRDKDMEQLEMQDQHMRYLSRSGNTAMLSAFVSNYITRTGPCRLTEDQTIILVGGFEDTEETKTILKDRVESLVDLMSDQEEADTRIVLHAIHLAKTYKRVIIKCDDTDVLVLLLYYASCSMFGSALVLMHKGKTGKERFVPIKMICEKLGKALCQCLPACHALTKLENQLLSQKCRSIWMS